MHITMITCCQGHNDVTSFQFYNSIQFIWDPASVNLFLILYHHFCNIVFWPWIYWSNNWTKNSPPPSTHRLVDKCHYHTKVNVVPYTNLETCNIQRWIPYQANDLYFLALATTLVPTPCVGGADVTTLALAAGSPGTWPSLCKVDSIVEYENCVRVGGKFCYFASIFKLR